MCEQEIIDRIRALCDARGWTIYRLSKKCDITYSTLCTMLHKGTAPSVPTLVKICRGFDISLSEFFDCNNGWSTLLPEQQRYLKVWNSLNTENQLALQKFAEYLSSTQEK